MQVNTLTTWTAMASVSRSSTLEWGGAVRRGRSQGGLQLAAPYSKRGVGPGAGTPRQVAELAWGPGSVAKLSGNQALYSLPKLLYPSPRP